MKYKTKKIKKKNSIHSKKALARSTDNTPDSMPVSMPGTKEQGATTAASLFGVSKEAVSDDDSVFIEL
jgi:hypothetical protein